MKKIFILFSSFLMTTLAIAQANTSSVSADAVSLKELEYNFGKIPQGKPVTHIFLFTNTGTTPLKLDNVQASCGCTTPEWSKDPVAPGETSKITVGYNAASDGPFTKYITITYNGTQNKQVIIKGEVWKTPTTSAPENEGLSSLRNQ
jgi:hypothetical protein